MKTDNRNSRWCVLAACAASLIVALATQFPTPTIHARTITDNAVGDNASQASSIGGAWQWNLGTMTLNPSSTSATFTGSFVDSANNGARGTISNGAVQGSNLTGRWTTSRGSGTVNWKLSGDTITGTGTSTGAVSPYTTWCGAKQGRPFPSGCAFAGQWTIDLNGAGTGTMNLTQIGTSVSGSYSTKLASGKVSGAISYVAGKPVLTGRLVTSRSSGNFKLYLADNSARQFSGNAGANVAWCGWRTGSTKPRTCLRS
jgi:hypothetical protein